MADFDLTVAPADVSATCRRQVADFTVPGVYAAGGYVIDPNDVRMGKIFAILFSAPMTAVAGVGYQAFYDASGGAIAFLRMSTGAEAADGTVLTDTVLRVEVIGQ